MRNWSTDMAPPPQRFEMWADVVCRTFAALDCDCAARAAFRGAIVRRELGETSVVAVGASAQRATRTRALLTRAPSDAIILMLQLHGEGEATQRGRTVRLGPGRGAAVRADAPYWLSFPGPFRQIVLKLPSRSVAADWIGATPVHAASEAGRTLTVLARSALSGDAPASEGSQIEGLAGALAALASATLRTPPPAGPRRWQAAMAAIEARLVEPGLTRAAVAGDLGVSTRTLSRILADGGATFERLLRERRLARCAEEIEAGRLARGDLTRIAHRWGFLDSAHFSRAFRARYGVAPSRFRQAAGADCS